MWERNTVTQHTKPMTIQKRLFLSHLVMILVPVIVAGIAGVFSAGALWIVLMHRMGITFQKIEDLEALLTPAKDSIETPVIIIALFFLALLVLTVLLTNCFLRTALSNAAPFAFVIMSEILFVRLFMHVQAPQMYTMMYLLLILIAMTAVVKSCIPMNPLRLFVCISMVLGTFGGLLLLPSLFHISVITGGIMRRLEDNAES